MNGNLYRVALMTYWRNGCHLRKPAYIIVILENKSQSRHGTRFIYKERLEAGWVFFCNRVGIPANLLYKRSAIFNMDWLSCKGCTKLFEGALLNCEVS